MWCFIVLAVFSGSASAHFLLNVNIRVFHVVHERDRIRLLVRLPMPYLVADKLGPQTADGTRVPAPYTTNRIEDGTMVHYLDAETFRNAPEGLAAILADGLVLETGGEVLSANIGRTRAYPARMQAPFALLDEAETALSGPVYPEEFDVTYVGDTIVALTSVGRRMTTLITALLGLLHGLGFSFVLSEILNLESANLWQSLLAFNVGIEIGQLLIVLALWPIPHFISTRLPNRIALIRWAVALPCILFATIWTGQRTMQFISSL